MGPIYGKKISRRDILRFLVFFAKIFGKIKSISSVVNFQSLRNVCEVVIYIFKIIQGSNRMKFPSKRAGKVKKTS